MHIKINITEMNPNFLLHILLYKTSLKNQQTHQYPLWILLYIFMIKNKHKLGNNISNRDKIMVNSPKVHFDKT
jgi:predicted type IV restriction endonuclease